MSSIENKLKSLIYPSDLKFKSTWIKVIAFIIYIIILLLISYAFRQFLLIMDQYMGDDTQLLPVNI